MNYKYRPDDYETKLIVLYTIESLKRSPSYQLLGQIITSSADINYFEIQHYIDELKELKTIEISNIDGEDVYTLTDAGSEMCEYFSDRIPASIREKISTSAQLINNDRSDENKVYADYVPINEHEYRVECGIMERNISILDFKIYAGPKDRAKKLCEYFKENTHEFFMELLNLLENKIDKE